MDLQTMTAEMVFNAISEICEVIDPMVDWRVGWLSEWTDVAYIVWSSWMWWLGSDGDDHYDEESE